MPLRSKHESAREDEEPNDSTQQQIGLTTWTPSPIEFDNY